MKYIDANFNLSLPNFDLDLVLRIDEGAITGLFGPSGAGKSTILRLIAGLETDLSGDMKISTDNEVWADKSKFVAPHLRGLAYVFQGSQLFPHLDVLGNLQFSSQRKQSETDINIDQVKQWLELDDLMNKRVSDLSGGETQRVCIARALLNGARGMLMDEPLAALDQQARYRILAYIDQIHKRLKFPFLYVSHAIDEITYLTNKLYILDKGKLKASGDTLKLAPLLDSNEANAVISCTMNDYDEKYELSCLQFESQSIFIAGKQAPASTVKLNIPAKDVSIALSKPSDSSILNIISGQIAAIHEQKNGKLLQVQVGNQYLLSKITQRSFDHLEIKVGKSIYAQIKSVSLISEYDK